MSVPKNETPTLSTLTFQSYLSFASRFAAYKLKGGKKHLHQLIHEDIFLELSQIEVPFTLESVIAPYQSLSRRKQKDALMKLRDKETRKAIARAVKPRTQYALAVVFAKHARSKAPRDVAKHIQNFKMIAEIVDPSEVGEDVVKQQFVNGLSDEIFMAQVDAMTQAMSLDDTYKTALSHAHVVDDALETAKPYVAKRARTGLSGGSSVTAQPAVTANKRQTSHDRTPSYQRSPVAKGTKCSYCYKEGHTDDVCFAKKKGISKCAHCLKLGHDEPVCRAKTAGRPKAEHAKLMMNISQDEKVLSGTAMINGEDITILFDTGASDNFIAKKHAPSVSHKSSTVSLANNSKLTTIGETKITVTVQPNEIVSHEITLEVTAQVVDTLPFDVILGYSTMLHTGLITTLTPAPKTTEVTDEEDLLLNTVNDVVTETPTRPETAHENAFGPLAIEPSLLQPYKLQLTPDAKMVSRPAYKVPDWKRAEIDKHIDGLLETGVIEPSTSPWGSPVVIVPKKNGKTRMCVDYSRINDQTTHFEYPLPRIEEMIDVLSQHHWFSTIDLSSGYHQIALAPESRDYTTFSTHRGRFRYTRLPFGLKHAGAHFQHAMELAFADLINSCCLIYQDDIVIYGKTKDELTKNQEKVFERCELLKIRLNDQKCSFMRDRITYLGWEIAPDGKHIDPARTDAIQAMKPTKTATGVRKFLGLANFFHDYLGKDYATLSEPLYASINTKPFDWTTECTNAFTEIQRRLTDDPVLAHYDGHSPLVLMTDASDVGVGGVLLQAGKPLLYMSKVLNKIQRRWPTIEKECFGIIHCLSKAERYLTARRFAILTDHRNLVHMHASTNAKVANWRILLEQFDYTINHVPGEDNAVADTLSRLFVIQPDQTNHILDAHVQAGCHLSIERTISLLNKRGHTSDDLRSEVKTLVQSCPVCQKTMPRPSDKQSDLVIDAPYVFHTVCVDTMGPYPMDGDYEHILVMVDVHSRYTEMAPMSSTRADEALNLFQDVWCTRHGVPKILVTDSGSQFKNKLFRQFATVNAQKNHYTTPYHHESNGICERVNREINKFMTARRIELGTQHRWSSHIPAIRSIINAMPNKTLGMSPNEVIFGYEPVVAPATDRMPSEIACCIEFNRRVALAKHSARHDAAKAKVNGQGPLPSYILLAYPDRAPSKLVARYRGPLRVVGHELNEFDAPRVLHVTPMDQPDKVLKVHASRTRRFDPGALTDTQMTALAATDNDEYSVESIVGHRPDSGIRTKNQLEFRVRWRGYEPEEDSWLPWTDVKELAALDEYVGHHENLHRLINK